MTPQFITPCFGRGKEAKKCCANCAMFNAEPDEDGLCEFHQRYTYCAETCDDFIEKTTDEQTH